MFRKRRTIVYGVIAIVLIGILLGVAARSRRAGVRVQTQKVGRQDLVSIVSASGEIKPKRYVNISSDVPGRIVAMLVKEGDEVKKGQVLCRIDSTRFAAAVRASRAALDQSRADLQRALADVDLARVDFERTERMHAERLVSDQAFDQARAQLQMKAAAAEVVRKRLAQLEASLTSDDDNLEKTTVVSPMNGVVTLLQKEEGETVIGAQSFQPTVIMTVADLSDMEVEILVDETDIKDLRLAQATEVRVDALPERKIKGKVTEIGASAIVRGGTTGTQGASTADQPKDFKVTVTIDDPPRELKPGVNATADITTATRDKALAVPIQAVVVREVGSDGKVIDPDTGAERGSSSARGSDSARDAVRPKGEEKEGVFVVENGLAVFRPVKTGIMGETDIEILKGLKAGETIVIGSYRTLRTLREKSRVIFNPPRKDKAREERSS